MISIIQILLTAAIIFLGFYSYSKLRSSYIDAALIFFFLILGITLVFSPELATKIAHYLGVGRGADLIFYVSDLFFLFLIMKLYLKVRRLEQNLTELVREKTIEQARTPDDLS